MFDKLLEKFGLKYEDLNAEEHETLHTWLDSLQKGQLRVEDIKTYITRMKMSVEHELTRSDVGSKQDLLLKARLRNYMLLESFLDSPDQAKKSLENALSRLAQNKVA